MENKYYTPTIEEFYVGFEYEAKGEVNEYTLGKEHFVVGGWKKLTFPDLYSGYNLSELFKTSFLRVKYLDKEDIESFNFKHEGSGWYKKDDPSGELGYWTMVSVRVWGDEITVRGHRGNKLDSTEQEILFRGVIKNKSELKKLLKQLNITNDN